MTSKISFIKLLKEDLKGRGWLLAIVTLFYFLALPVSFLLQYGEQMQQVYAKNMSLYELIAWFQNFVGMGNFLVGVGMVGTAILCGITGFSYLHSKEKLDFYHSFAVRREKLFAVQFLSGVLIFVLPYLLNLFLCFALGAIKGVTSTAVILTGLSHFAFVVFYFLFHYVVVILAMVMTGKIIVGMMGIVVFFAYAPLVGTLADLLGANFFSTYYRENWTDNVGFYVSPLTLCVRAWTGTIEGKVLLISTVLLILVAVVTFVLYRVRPSEAVGKAMAFQKTEAVIKVLLTIPISLFAGLIFSILAGEGSDAWFLFGIIFAAVVMNAVIEFIYHMDLKELFTRKLSFGAAILVVLVITGIYRFDLVGYDTFLPAQEKVSSMSLHVMGYHDILHYPGKGNVYTQRKQLADLQITDFAPVYQIAKAGVEQKKEEAVHKIEKKSILVSQDDTIGVTVKYQLKNGKEAYRNYEISREMVEENLGHLIDSKTYKEKVFPIYYLEESALDRITVQDRQSMVTDLNMGEADRSELLKTYQDELKDMTYAQMKKSDIVAMLSFAVDEDGAENIYDGFPVYEDCEKTIAAMEKNGYLLKKEVDVSEVRMIQVDAYGPKVQGNDKKHATFIDEADKKQILESGYPGNFRSYTLDQPNYNLSCFIEWATPGGDRENSFVFKGELPECIRTTFS